MSFSVEQTIDDKRRLAFLRVRDAAFEAVITLWRRRKAQGMTQKDIGVALERDPAWVSRNLAGPGNWTMKTFGELVEALDGHAFVEVHAHEDIKPSNYSAYFDFEDDDFVSASPVYVTFAGRSGSVVAHMRSPGTEDKELVKVAVNA